MDISFDLPYDQRVSFTYNIGLISGPYCYFLSKMEINGEEDRLFRAQSNNSDYPSVFRFGEVFLKAGTYRIVVSYKTNSDKRLYGSSVSGALPQGQICLILIKYLHPYLFCLYYFIL